jgi:hypothetical protein
MSALKAQTANSISPEPCGEASGAIGVLSDISLPRPNPYDVIKAPDPPRHAFASSEGHVEPLGKTGSQEPPTTALAPIDEMDVTVHSQ